MSLETVRVPSFARKISITSVDGKRAADVFCWIDVPTKNNHIVVLTYDVNDDMLDLDDTLHCFTPDMHDYVYATSEPIKLANLLYSSDKATCSWFTAKMFLHPDTLVIKPVNVEITNDNTPMLKEVRQLSLEQTLAN